MISGVLSMLLLSNCTKDFEQLNTPPTSVVTIDPGLLLSGVIKDGTFAEGGELPNNKFGSWVQHWAGGPVVPVSRYIESAEDNIWEQHYALIRNLRQIAQELQGQEDSPTGKSKLAIAKIYEVVIWQRLTDLFGDVPFSEVTNDPTSIVVTPAFDSQEQIYTTLISWLDESIARLDAGDNTYGSADFFYGGDVAKWAKFANSLKLKLGMRIRFANPQLAQQTVESAMNSSIGLLASNNDNAAVPTYNNAQAENFNPMLSQYVRGSSDLRYLANTLIDQLKADDDPRLPLLVQPTVNSVAAGQPDYAGLGVALTDNELAQIIRANYSTASLSTWFSQTFAPIPCYALTYSEVSFFKAEAALLGWGATSADTETFFLEGVRAAFALPPYNISSLPGTYVATALSLEGLTDEQKLEKIQTQKWIHLFGRNYEAFAEWRRTGYPLLVPGNNPGSTNGQIPRRAIYSTQEAQLNGTNYNNAVNRMSNGDTFLSRVWWDKRTE